MNLALMGYLVYALEFGFYAYLIIDLINFIRRRKDGKRHLSRVTSSKK